MNTYFNLVYVCNIHPCVFADKYEVTTSINRLRESF